MRNLLLIPLAVFTLSAQDTQVCSQGPNYTLTAPTTKPGLEVDLTRSLGERNESYGVAQWRLGLTQGLDIRCTNSTFSAQGSVPVSDSVTVGVQRQWGSKQDRWVALITKSQGPWTIDTNLGVNYDKDPMTHESKRSYVFSSGVGRSIDSWSLGGEVVIISPQQGSLSSSIIPMCYVQFQPKAKFATYLGVSKEINLAPHNWGSTFGCSLRF